MDGLVVAIAFGTIFLVELPDKTFLATLVLATRYRPVLVWVGVGAAFTVQTGIAVGLGQVAGLLPEAVVQAVAGTLFALGAALLVRAARSHARTGDEPGREPATGSVGGFGAVTASFVTLFAAEWGDLSQVLTLSLVARYDAAASVFVGALAALLAVSGLAVLVGSALVRRVPLHRIYYAGAVVCTVLAALVVRELVADLI